MDCYDTNIESFKLDKYQFNYQLKIGSGQRKERCLFDELKIINNLKKITIHKNLDKYYDIRNNQSNILSLLSRKSIDYNKTILPSYIFHNTDTIHITNILNHFCISGRNAVIIGGFSFPNDMYKVYNKYYLSPLSNNIVLGNCISSKYKKVRIVNIINNKDIVPISDFIKSNNVDYFCQKYIDSFQFSLLSNHKSISKIKTWISSKPDLIFFDINNIISNKGWDISINNLLIILLCLIKDIYGQGDYNDRYFIFKFNYINQYIDYDCLFLFYYVFNKVIIIHGDFVEINDLSTSIYIVAKGCNPRIHSLNIINSEFIELFQNKTFFNLLNNELIINNIVEEWTRINDNIIKKMEKSLKINSKIENDLSKMDKSELKKFINKNRIANNRSCIKWLQKNNFYNNRIENIQSIRSYIDDIWFDCKNYNSINPGIDIVENKINFNLFKSTAIMLYMWVNRYKYKTITVIGDSTGAFAIANQNICSFKNISLFHKSEIQRYIIQNNLQSYKLNNISLVSRLKPTDIFLIIDYDVEDFIEIIKLTSDYNTLAIINTKNKLLEYQLVLNRFRKNVMSYELNADRHILIAWDLINYPNKS